MSKFIITLSTLLLVACGNGNDNQQVSTYGYNGMGGGPVAPGMCSPRLAMDWNALVAAPCNNTQGFGGDCARGTEMFIQRNTAEIQGPGCSLATNSVQWCPGQDWRSHQTFQVNVAILQSAILTQRGGPGAFPVNGPQGPGGPRRF